MRIPPGPVARLLPLLLVACAGAPKLPSGTIVGEAMEPRETVHLAVVEADPKPYFEKTLLIEATAVAVCRKKGCWMQIEDGGRKAMVRWEEGCGGRFAFPQDLEGRRVLVQGSIYPKSISEADAEHLEEEAGAGVEIAREGLEINASSVLRID